jgi:hypothetical protein
MGWLARQDGYDPDAFDVPGEQTTGVGWANRMGEILHARRPDDPTVVATTASPLVTITEGDIGRATDAAMGVSGGGLSTKGIKAYHSSPHDFDKFDLAKIGTGEGAQVYGHGLYFAENPAVSGQGGQYWNQFLNKFEGPERQAAEELMKKGFDRKAAETELRAALEGLKGKPMAEELYGPIMEKWQRQLDVLQGDKPVGPRTYEVNINADPAHMLDWDKGLQAQSPQVLSLLRDRGVDSNLVRRWLMEPEKYNTARGENIYGQLADKHGFAEASQHLNELGIPGIKYLDQGSRGPSQQIAMLQAQLEKPGWRPETRAEIQAKLDALLQQPPPSSNYVIFDPNLIRIDKKYALPLAAAPAGMGALAAQDRYE